MKAKQKKVAPDTSEFANFADYLARVVTHPQTPPTLKSALQAVVVNTMSNNSDYQWADDAEGLRFIVPRTLRQMDEGYASGIIHSTREFIADSLPEKLKGEISEWAGVDAAGVRE